MDPRPIAFYLPQFHPTPENDRWWGKGFTEWTNVARARPRFTGHYQPHIPADLGFYDLRLAEVREAQASLARQYGVSGFCYYHYWFHGKRLLSLPLDAILKERRPDFPFCLCWANEDWTRTWDGNQAAILIKQEYSLEDDRRHMNWLARVFEDPRYIRVHGKPIFLVYRASKLPEAMVTAEIWRDTARRMGVGEIHLCNVESFPEEKINPLEIGFDSAVEFQPDWGNLGEPVAHLKDVEQRVFNYATFAKRQMAKPSAPYVRFPCVAPSWDNSARRLAGAVTMAPPDPDGYRNWLRHAISLSTQPGSETEGIVFVNAWNEWAEGNHLEPDQRMGHAYLQATLDALRGGVGKEVVFPEEDKIIHVGLGDRRLISETQDQAAYALMLQQQLLIAEGEIARIRSTVSWKITKPLRGIRNLLARIK